MVAAVYDAAMPHLAGTGWKTLRPLADLPATWLTPAGDVAWMAWEPPGVAGPGPVWTRTILAKGRIHHRLALPGRLPRRLAGHVLPLVEAACAGLPGWRQTGGTRPRLRPWAWGAERPRSRLFAPPPEGDGLEIGFGGGGHLLALPAGARWWGLESSRHSVDAIVRKSPAQATVAHLDAALALPCLGTASFGAVIALFPDPWPKERHARRRWLDAAALAHLRRVVRPGGLLGLATDHPDLAAHFDSVLAAAPGFAPAPGRESELALSHSKYAAKAAAAGRPIRSWTLTRDDAPATAPPTALEPPPWEVGPAPRAAPLRGQSERGAGGVAKVVEAASGPHGLLLHLLHASPHGHDQAFLLRHDGKRWLWDGFTAPLGTPDLLATVRALAAEMAA